MHSLILSSSPAEHIDRGVRAVSESALEAAAADLDVTVRIVDAGDWDHGDAKGICTYQSLHDFQPVVEAKVVAYIVGRYFGLDTSGSAFYLAAGEGDDSEAIQECFGRISFTAQEIMRALGE